MPNNTRARTIKNPLYFPNEAARTLLRPPKPSGSKQQTENDLTPREREVLALVAQGLSNKEVGGVLALSEHTVRNHLRNILEKLHLRNRVEAATYAIKAGLIPPQAPVDSD